MSRAIIPTAVATIIPADPIPGSQGIPLPTRMEAAVAVMGAVAAAEGAVVAAVEATVAAEAAVIDDGVHFNIGAEEHELAAD